MNMKLTKDMVSSSLNVAPPANTSKDLGRRNNPVAGMSMVLPISEIDFFNRNPRKMHNPEEFEHLKNSIREIGVQQPVHVTTPPGRSRYMLAKGGNSRLLCLQQLLAETGDERFSRIPAIYIEYSSEEDMLAAHLIENEQRSDMCFWDKACAYADMRDMFQSAVDEPLGARPLAQKIAEKGLTIHFTKLSMYLFAADHLAGLGHLCNFLSNAKAFELRKIYNDLQSAVKDDGKADDEAFEMLWDETLEGWAAAHADADDLDVAALQKNLQQTFADVFEIAAVSAPGTSAVAGHVPSDKTALPRPAPAAEKEPAQGQGGVTEPSDANGFDEPVQPQFELTGGSQPPQTPDAGQPDGKSGQATEPEPRSPNQIRADICKAVRKLLACVRLESLLIEDAQMPYGWMLDFPDFNKSGWNDNVERAAMINIRHDLAATVFLYLWTVSGEKALWDNPQLLKRYNPFTNKPDSIIQTIYPDNDLRREAEEFGIAMHTYGDRITELMFELAMRDKAALQAYIDLLLFTAELEENAGDNWDRFQEQL